MIVSKAKERLNFGVSYFLQTPLLLRRNHSQQSLKRLSNVISKQLMASYAPAPPPAQDSPLPMLTVTALHSAFPLPAHPQNHLLQMVILLNPWLKKHSLGIASNLASLLCIRSIALLAFAASTTSNLPPPSFPVANTTFSSVITTINKTRCSSITMATSLKDFHQTLTEVMPPKEFR